MTITRKSLTLNNILIWAGRVPFGQKIIGIVVAPLLLLGFTMAWWVSSELGGWLSYLLSEERVEQAMSVGMRGVFIITIFAAFAGLIIAWLLVWVLTRPILHITRVARQVEKGDLSLRASVWAKDEIGELGSTFNAMIESLARSRKELETSNEQLHRRNHELAMLYELAQMTIQHSETEQVLEHGLDQVLALSGAEVGLVALLDSEQNLKICVQRSRSDSSLDVAQVVETGRELLAEIVETGEPRFTGDITADPAMPGGLAALCRAAHYSAYIGIPIGTKGKALGVLSVLRRATDNLDKEQRSLLLTVCNQIGIAVENSQLWTELQQKERVRSQLLNKIVSAQEEERRRISRELHDETGQSLTSLLVQLKVLESTADIEIMRQRIHELRDLTARTLEEVRRLSLDLRPAALDDLGIVPALDWYVHEHSRKVGIRTEFSVQDLDGFRLPHEAEVIVYRVVQEALSNVARHSHATHTWVEIRCVNEIMSVSIRDNGQGFNVEETLRSPHRGLGLLGMQERMELIGGTFHLSSMPGEGTRVSIEVKLTPERLS